METLHSMFEKSACSFAANIAITFNYGAIQRHLRYQELDRQASRVADFLTSLIDEKKVVAVYSRQSIELVVCLLGILKNGSCFAPIDVDWPPDVVFRFLSKLSVNYILVEKKLVENFKSSLEWKPSPAFHDNKFEFITNEVLDSNGFIFAKKISSIALEAETANSLGLAYIMQSSGTTGEAKAVKVPHCCIVPNITDIRRIFQLSPDDTILLASPYTFDPFIVQMFIAFATGARVVIVPDSVKLVPSKLCQILFDEEKITVLQPTPSLMHYIGQELINSKVLCENSSLRVLAFGGESCPTLSTLRKWRNPSNRTLIYNLYGITEVSCWASCYLIPVKQLLVDERCSSNNSDSSFAEFPGDAPVDLVNNVPIGLPLLDTIIEVRDESNCIVQEGMGQIYLGGSDRVCLLGDETSLINGTLRATGDWAYVKDGCIWFCGRKDRQIKRMGKRINLDTIEQEISEKLSSKPCSLVLEKLISGHFKIHLFVADNLLSKNSEIITSSLPHEAKPDFIHMVSHLPITAHGKVDRKALLKSILKISDSFATASVREFLEYAWKESLLVSDKRRTFSFVGKYPQNLDGENVGENDTFLACGGSSLSAVKLADIIESWTVNQRKSHVKLHDLLEVILSKNFGALCFYVESKLSEALVEVRSDVATSADQNGMDRQTCFEFNPTTVENGVHEVSLKRKLSNSEESFHRNKKEGLEIIKRVALTSSINENRGSCHNEISATDEWRDCFCCVQRCNQFSVCKDCRNSQPTEAYDGTRQRLVLSAEGRVTKPSSVSSNEMDKNADPQSHPSSIEKEAVTSKIAITYQWRTNLRKCIDASPVVVHSRGVGEGEVFIGSHSHIFMCIRLSDGEILWERRLGDRIESSAALSACGRLVIVGCYDGKVYVFNRFTGETHWTFETEAAVKSSPCVEPQTGVAWCGSHDGHLYGLDVANKQCLCAIHCGGGSCFSSPCVSSDRHLVFIATLAGRVLAIDATEHAIVWSHQCPKPIFASLRLIPTGIVCACVDGCVYCFDFQGNLLWKFETQPPIFCSPSYIGLNSQHSSLIGFVVFGSHDKSVFCLSPSGELQWTYRTDAQVYSSPFIADLSVSNSNTTCHATCNATSKNRGINKAQLAVFVFSTVGTLYALDLFSGALLDSYSLDGEVFSSPVVVGKQILVGCRNDYLYSLEFATA